MRGGNVGRVLASKSDRAKEGDIVSCWPGWTEVAILSEKQFVPAASMPKTNHPTDLLSSLGTTSLTAYFGMKKIGQPKPGETVVISGAAGATGSVAGQIAKLNGARVIGIAGADDKCKWLTEELGFDEALNYKDPDFKAKFREATKNYIDVYWDNGTSTTAVSCSARSLC
jgi:NADPH-dependent curcumin reductase CurA